MTSGGMRHISTKRWLYERMRPPSPMTRMPSAVESSVDCSSVTALRDFALGALALAHVAADDHRARGLAVMHDRRDRERQVDALAVASRAKMCSALRSERRRSVGERIVVARRQEIFDALPISSSLVVAEERRRRGWRTGCGRRDRRRRARPPSC